MMKKCNISGSVLLIFIGMAFTLTALGQKRPVKENFIPEYRLPTPPAASCAQAYSLANCHMDTASGCSTDKIDQDLSDRLENLVTTLSGLSLPAANPREMEKKMEGMTDAQKQAMAMQMAHQYMQNTASGQGYAPESPDVMKAEAAYGNLMQTFATRTQRPEFSPQNWIAMQKKYQAQRDALQQWYKVEYKKLPPDRSPKAVFEKDPAAMHQLDIHLAQRYIDIENAYLHELSGLWVRQKAAYQSMYAEFENALEKIHYGDDVKGNSINSQLAEGQKILIQGILYLIGETRDADKEAAEYQLDLVNKEKS